MSNGTRLFSALVSFLTLSFASMAAHATIYLVSLDPATHSVGIAAISSGPVVSYSPHAMNGLKGIGFTGWSGSTLNVSPAMDKQVFQMMQQGAPANQIAAFVDGKIHNKYSRYIFVSTQGTLGYVFPPRGCQEPECGVQAGSTGQFFVMGGGLQHDVVANTVKIYERIFQNTQLPFECKLLAGIQTIINVGGEIKDFNEAGIGIDNPKLSNQEWFTSTDVPEKGIVELLRASMSKAGVNCPALRQVTRDRVKHVRDPKSLDL